MSRIKITEEMKLVARQESNKRESFIKHHFKPKHSSLMKTNEVGFIGEFCFCEFLGLDWRKNIRSDYKTIDNYDLVFNSKRIDVKTETIPHHYATKLLNNTIKDDDKFGRRLYSSGQFKLLEKYDYIVFGLIIRNTEDFWYPLGFTSAGYILKNYRPTLERPDGGAYQSPGAPIKTSSLQPIRNFFNI